MGGKNKHKKLKHGDKVSARYITKNLIWSYLLYLVLILDVKVLSFNSSYLIVEAL